MFRTIPAILLATALAGVATCAFQAHAASELTLRAKPEVDLPFGDDVVFPGGPGSDVITSNCLTCHSADHTLNQPSLSKEEWHKVVDKMINAYKAPISPADATVIVDYLTRIKGEPEKH